MTVPTITINKTEIVPIVFNGVRVITLSMMDKVHERPEGTARRNFNKNKDKLKEGVDYFRVSANEIRTHKIMDLPAKAREAITLLAESGYLMLVKSFTDHLAWQVQRQLVNGYFRKGAGNSYSDSPALEKPLSVISKDFAAANDLAKLFGFTGNQALLSANRAIKQIHAIDCAKLMGATHLLADSQDILLTVTEISQRTGIPRNQVNPILERLGLQKPYRDHRNKLQWELTSEGRKYGIYQDTGKKHSNGTPVRQIKWNAELVERLKEALEQVPALNEAAH